MERYLALILLVLAIGCTKQAPVANQDSPSKVLLQTYDALNISDSTTFLSLITKVRREDYAEHPEFLKNSMERWRHKHADVQILSETHDSTTAQVQYRIKMTGAITGDTTRFQSVYLEDGKWKVGY